MDSCFYASNRVRTPEAASERSGWQADHRDLHALTRALRRGSLPRLATVERLRTAARLDLGKTYSTLGINLDRLAWLRAHVNLNRTRPAPSHAYLRETPVFLPVKLQRVEKPYRTMPLTSIVAEWRQQPIRNLEQWRRRPCIYAQVGLHDGMSYPDIPPGAFLQIDPEWTEVDGPSEGQYYFVRHPFGYSCCRCALDGKAIFLLPSSRLYPQLEFFHPGTVQILGRVRAFCANIDQVSAPPAVSLKQLKQRRVKMERSPAELANTGAGGAELLQNERLCLGIPYEELNQATASIHNVAEEFSRFHITNGHAHKLEHQAGLVPSISTLCALSAYYALDYAEILRAYGFSLTEDEAVGFAGVPSGPDRDDQPVCTNDIVKEEFASFLLDRWLEWPPLLSQISPDLPSRKIFFFGGNSGVEPILKPGSFLVIDESQIAAKGSLSEQLGDWERPLYMLYTREDGFIVQYAERDGKHLLLFPHRLAYDRRQRTLLCPAQAELIGKVTFVAALL